jgi:MFS family permease
MKAFAVYGAAAPAGGTAGVFLGGVITEWIAWPWVFYINIPIALLVLAAIPALMPDAPARRGSIDLAGALTATAGLAVTVFGIVRAPDEGWGSSVTLLTLAGGLAALAVFVAIQARRREPLMRLSILRTPNLAAANLAQLLLGAAWIPMWFFLNLYVQQVLGYSAFEGGAALLPMTVAIMGLMVFVAPRVVNRFGFKPPIVAGMLLLAAGMAIMSLVRADGSFVADVLPASLIAAAGMSLAFIPSLGTAIGSAKPEEGGLAAGIVNTSYQVGSALGLAAMTAVAASQAAGRLGDLGALTDGYSAAFLGAAAIAAVGAMLAALLLRTSPPDASAVTPSETPADDRQPVAA